MKWKIVSCICVFPNPPQAYYSLIIIASRVHWVINRVNDHLEKYLQPHLHCSTLNRLQPSRAQFVHLISPIPFADDEFPVTRKNIYAHYQIHWGRTSNSHLWWQCWSVARSLLRGSAVCSMTDRVNIDPQCGTNCWLGSKKKSPLEVYEALK